MMGCVAAKDKVTLRNDQAQSGKIHPSGVFTQQIGIAVLCVVDDSGDRE